MFFTGSAIGAVTVSVFVFWDFSIVYLNKWKKTCTNIQLYFFILCSTPQTKTTTSPEYSNLLNIQFPISFSSSVTRGYNA